MERTKFTIFLCIALAGLFGGQAEEDKETISRTLPAYTIALNADHINSTECQRDLKIFIDGVDRRILWALKVLDSSGESRPGFIYGNNYWLGSRSQCRDIMNRSPLILAETELRNNSQYRKSEEEFPPYDINYFVARFRHNSTLQYHVRLPNEDLVTLGLCLPASCSSNDLRIVLNKIFRERTLLIGDLYKADFSLVDVKDLVDDHQWLLNGKLFIVVIVMVLTIALMIIGTVYDIFVHQTYLTAQKRVFDLEHQKNGTYVGGKLMLETPDAALTEPRQESRLGQFFTCFSVYTNSKIIFDTRLSEDSIPLIHGLKFLGMMWIVMIHTIFYTADYVDNKPLSWRKAEGFAEQVIGNSTLSVDTFFFLSGFLVSHLYLKSASNKKDPRKVNYYVKINEFLMMVLRRFLRLTPAYMMIVGIAQLNFGWYAQTSQFYFNENPFETCDKYWWRNILYINNLFSRKEMCLSWSWYLSNDMQFFIIGTFLTIVSTIYFNVAAVLLMTLLFGSMFITGYLAYIYHYIPTLDEQYNLLDVLYDPPWTRIGPYLVGMITAYYLIKLNSKLNLRKTTIALCWCFGSSCNILVLFGIWQRRMSITLAAIYVGTCRTVWAVGLAWLLIACCTKHGGIVNNILSFKAWVPLSRLTYCAYLINPLILNSMYLYNETSVHIDFLANGTTFLGVVMVSYMCAYVLTLMFETPYILMIRLIMSGRSKKT